MRCCCVESSFYHRRPQGPGRARCRRQCSGWRYPTALIAATANIPAYETASHKQEIVKFLLGYDIDANAFLKWSSILRTNYQTLLVPAICRAEWIVSYSDYWRYRKNTTGQERVRFDIIKVLLEKGANVNAFGGSKHPLALIEAIIVKKSNLLDVLLHHGASANATCARSNTFRTALQAAAYNHDIPTMQKLIAAGANVSLAHGLRDPCQIPAGNYSLAYKEES